MSIWNSDCYLDDKTQETLYMLGDYSDGSIARILAGALVAHLKSADGDAITDEAISYFCKRGIMAMPGQRNDG